MRNIGVTTAVVVATALVGVYYTPPPFRPFPRNPNTHIYVYIYIYICRLSSPPSTWTLGSKTDTSTFYLSCCSYFFFSTARLNLQMRLI